MYRHVTSSGMSLLHVLITLALISVLLTTGISSYASLIKKYQLNGAVQAIYYLLQHGRSQTVSLQQNVVIDFEPTNPWCVGITINNRCDCTITGSCTIDNIEWVVTQHDYPRVSVTDLNFGSKQLAMFTAPRAISAGHAGSVVLSDNNYKLKLILSNMGRIRICAVNKAFSPYHPC
ncbi:MAG: prepilin peptidase dependent protein A [Alteromonadaceae bacterium]|nr:prepilin peptidase dependent protein A [Alteromonadaceae bacterium]